MEFKKFFETWKGAQLENRTHRILVMALVVSNIILGMAAFTRSEVVVLTPPDLTQAIKVARDQGDQGYSETWGYSIALMLGNVTPGNADFTKRALAPLLAPAIYQDVLNELYRQAEQIKIDRVSIRFEPRAVVYETKTGKVFVTGYSYAMGPSGKQEQSTRTYELVIRVFNYQPNVTYMNTYLGEAHTLDYLERNVSAGLAAPSKAPVTPAEDAELAAMMKKNKEQK